MDNTDYTKEIFKNNYLYNLELKQAARLWRKGHTVEALEILCNLANFAWNNYSGFHSSAPLESLLAEISKAKLNKQSGIIKKSETTVTSVLHVGTRFYETGGHTPLMLKWMQRDNKRRHDLFVTLQSSTELPEKQFAKHNFSKTNVVFTRDNNETLLEVAQKLYDTSAGYDLVVLHIHPDDIIPNLAFANHKRTPVYVMNHADHSFWLGASIADGMVQIRETNFEIDANRRGIPGEKQFYLPIPVETTVENITDKFAIVKKLGIENFDTILLSTSGENKFVFFKEYDYYKSIIPVLDKNPQAVLLIVGVGPASWMAEKYPHPQIKFLGVVPPNELAEIESIADIYVENLPYSSFTALLQVFMRKKAIQFVYAPLNITQLFADESVYTKDLKEWQELLDKLINDKIYRDKRTINIYNKNFSDYTPDTWKHKVEQIYKSVQNLILTFNTLPEKPVENISDNEILLYKVLRQRYVYKFFRKSPVIFIRRWLNFMVLNLKGYKLKKNY